MRKSGKIGRIAIALIALMGLSCSGAEAPRQPASLAEISGQWDVVSFDGFTPVRLNYQGDRNTRVDITEDFIGLKLTCNSTGIAARLSEDGRLIKNPRGSGAGVTAMSCPEIDRERQFFSLFFDEPKVERPSTGYAFTQTNTRSSSSAAISAVLSMRQRLWMRSAVRGMWRFIRAEPFGLAENMSRKQ